MAGSRVSSLPFAFLLALASETGGAAAPMFDTSQKLESGSLSNLLNEAAAVDRLGASNNHEQKSLEDYKTAQYFPNFPNFRNCFSGNWRNC